MTLHIEYDNGDSGYTNLSKEQAEDIEWLAMTTADSYAPIHEIMKGIKKSFEMAESE